MLVHASDQVYLHKSEINEANFFPVPDSDTGSNLVKTLLPIKKTAQEDISDEQIISKLLHSALLAAQGNSGIVFSAFLKGFLLNVKHVRDIEFEDLRLGIHRGYESALSSIQNPLPGTMLDLMEGLDMTFQNEKNSVDIEKIFEKSLTVLRKKVYETEEKMNVLKENHVVDAGAIGFYFIIKGFSLALGMSDFDEKKFVNDRVFKRHKKNEIEDHVYEVVSIINNPSMVVDEMQKMLEPHGNCLDIIEIEENVKIHIHTDTPEVVKEMVSLFGDIDSQFIVDMRTNESITV
jgi:dihydroxyacetone kinase-like predicted kinase